MLPIALLSKKNPRFQVGDPALSAIYSSPESWFGFRHFPRKPESDCGDPSQKPMRRLGSAAYAFDRLLMNAKVPGYPTLLRAGAATYPFILNAN
jgi:hypothetical protein